MNENLDLLRILGIDGEDHVSLNKTRKKVPHTRIDRASQDYYSAFS